MGCPPARALLSFLPLPGLSLLTQARPQLPGHQRSPCRLGHHLPSSMSCDQPPSHCTCSGLASPAPPAAATSVTSLLITLSSWPPSFQWTPPLQNCLGPLVPPPLGPVERAWFLLSRIFCHSHQVPCDCVSLGILAWLSFPLECLFLSSVSEVLLIL